MMADPSFHSVDPDVLKSFTVQDIQTGNVFPDQVLDYSIPIPTVDQRILHSQQDAWLTIEFGYDPTVLPDFGPVYGDRSH